MFAGCRNKEMGKSLKELFQTPYFRIVVVPDEETVEMCGALKVLSLALFCIITCLLKTLLFSVGFVMDRICYMSVTNRIFNHVVM